MAKRSMTGSISPAGRGTLVQSAPPISDARAQVRPKNARLRRIAAGLRNAGTEHEEEDLRRYLLRHPRDADALFLMAQVESRKDHTTGAVALLEQALDAVPDFLAARYLLAKLLIRLHRYEQADDEVSRLLAGEPRNRKFRQMRAAIQGAIGDDEGSSETWRELVEENPELAELWIGRGDSLRAVGRQSESLAAYRRATDCRPSFGRAWWCLANMKTVRMDEADIAGMVAQLAGSGAGPEDRANLLFALGKAYEDRGDYGRAFEHYAKGNAARRLRNEYDWNDIANGVAVQKEVFTRDFLNCRSGAGFPARNPIFILGRPRSGSTLIEQILSSHTEVEGTAELPYVADLAFELDDRDSGRGGDGYPRILDRLEPLAFAKMGESFMEKASVHRRLGRPRFIDKAPANYHHTGLIALMLPNAKIVDARRNPAACCFSMFKHNYDETNLRLGELGLVWRNYAELMAHFDRVMPGRVHRVVYEQLVADPRTEIDRLLDFLELPFEENCLRFHETKRTVRSPSSEQVRQPISSEPVEHWRNFEPWLGPLLDSLGPALSSYPRVPEDIS